MTPRTPTDHRPCRTLSEAVAEINRQIDERTRVQDIVWAKRREREAKEEGQ